MSLVKKITLTCLLWVSFVGTQSAFAIVVCKGVPSVGFDMETGGVYVYAGGLSNHIICLMRDESVASKKCNMVYATLLSAQLAKKEVSLFFKSRGGATDVPACDYRPVFPADNLAVEGYNFYHLTVN
ncbi:MAG: hypothetical protein HQK52_06030 [Oligoflexia bacterium]|nr:hypothetical protein [Oligoflexia bacterium]